MANKEIIIPFKLNGIDQSIKSTETLNDRLQKTNSLAGNNSSTIVDSNGKIISSVNEINTAYNAADESGKKFGESIKTGADNASKGLDDLKNKPKELVNNLDEAGNKSKSFGTNLARSTKDAAQAIGALATGLQLIGLQDDKIAKVSAALRVTAELLKFQSSIAEGAFSDNGIIEQTKSLGILTTATKGQTAAMGAEAVATEGATVATKGFTAAISANPLGAIIIGLGALVTAYTLLSESVADQIDKQNKLTDALIYSNEQIQISTDLLNERAVVDIDKGLTALQSQLQLVQAQNGSLQEQARLKELILQKEIELAKEAKSKADQDAVNATAEATIRKDRLEEAQKAFDKSKSGFFTDSAGDKELKAALDEAQKSFDAADAKRKESEIRQVDFANKYNDIKTNGLTILRAETAEQQRQLTLSQQRNVLELQNNIDELTKQIKNRNEDSITEQFKQQLDALRQEIEIQKKKLNENVRNFTNDSGQFTRELVQNQLQEITDAIGLEYREYAINQQRIRDEAQSTSDYTISLIEKEIEEKRRNHTLSLQEEILYSTKIDAIKKSTEQTILNSLDSVSQKSSQLSTKVRDNFIKSGILSPEGIKEVEAQFDILSNLFLKDADFLGATTKKAKEELISQQALFLTFLEGQLAGPYGFILRPNIDFDKREVDKKLKGLTDYVKNRSEENPDFQIPLSLDNQSITTDLDGLKKEVEDQFANKPVRVPYKLDNASGNVNKSALGVQADSIKKDSEFIDKLLKDELEKLKDAQDVLNDNVEQFGFTRIGLFIHDRNQLRQITDDVIVQINKQRAITKKAIDDNSELTKEQKEKLKEGVDKTFDGYVKDVEDANRSVGKSFRQTFDKILGYVNQAIQGVTDAYIGILDAQNDLEDARADRRRAQLEQEISEIQEAEDRKQEIVSESQSRINELEDELRGARGNRHAYILSLIATEQRKKQQAENEDAKLKEERAKREAEVKQIELEQTKRGLQLDKVRAEAQIALGAIQAYTSLSSIPVVGPFLGAAAALAVIAAGKIQIDNINEQIDNVGKFEDGGPADKFKKIAPGLVNGPSHKQGGVKAELQGNEFIVNADSTMLNYDIIDRINNEKNTKFDLIPAGISSIKSFENGGSTVPDFGKIEPALASQTGINGDKLIEAISQLNITVSVVDINDGIARVAKITDVAKI